MMYEMNVMIESTLKNPIKYRLLSIIQSSFFIIFKSFSVSHYLPYYQYTMLENIKILNIISKLINYYLRAYKIVI